MRASRTVTVTAEFFSRSVFAMESPVIPDPMIAKSFSEGSVGDCISERGCGICCQKDFVGFLRGRPGSAFTSLVTR